jgi:hypothetical protein
VGGLVAILFGLAGLGAPARASALAQPQDTLTYMPTGLFFARRSPAEVHAYLEQLDSYGIGQALLQMPVLKRNGTLKLKGHEAQMIPVWAQDAAGYDLEHEADLSVTAVINGHPKKRSLNLELPATRANVIASIEAVVSLGVSGVQLDFEPYPTSAGFVTLLAELHGALARRGLTGRLSVVAPTSLGTWSPAYLAAVAANLDQIDPAFYDSELTSAGAYESWVRAGLAFYGANVGAGTRIVPVIPSYGPNQWHLPSVENIATATSALEAALADGSRVNGAGIWWWWGFFYDEGGAYDAGADRAAWPATLALAFSP